MKRLLLWQLLTALAFSGTYASLFPGDDSNPITFAAKEVGTVVYENSVRVPKVSYMRLFFKDLILNENTLRITGQDGAVQHLDQRRAKEWGSTSAFFNGDSVKLEVLAGSKEPSFVKISLKHVQTDRTSLPTITKDPKSICYEPDTRVMSNDTRQGRYIYDDPNGCCTAWMINDEGNCFLSAGHCTDVGYGVVEFMVPLSADDGTLVHPPPEHQYAVDQESMQFAYSGVDDWRYFGVHPNTETGLHPIRRYGGDHYRLARSNLPAEGATIKIIGYGENESFPQTERRVQKEATGPFVSAYSNKIDYRVDTSNGNSGSAVYVVDTDEAVGIHTNGGCRVGSSGSANYGTSIFDPKLQAALASPRGVCAPRKE